MEREQGQQQDMCQEWRTCIFEVIIIHCFASTAGSIRPRYRMSAEATCQRHGCEPESRMCAMKPMSDEHADCGRDSIDV